MNTSVTIQQFKSQLTDYHHKCGADQRLSLPELLWECYYQSDPVDDGRIRQAFAALEPVFLELDFDGSNLLWDNLDELITAHQRAAFLEGIHLGVQLADTLSAIKKCTP